VLDLDHLQGQSGVFDYGGHGFVRYCQKSTQVTNHYSVRTIGLAGFCQCALCQFLWHAGVDGSE
jgi:hypothetical protein